MNSIVVGKRRHRLRIRIYGAYALAGIARDGGCHIPKLDRQIARGRDGRREHECQGFYLN